MTKKHYDVMVVGGGMVGAAVASALGGQGIRVAVFDREPVEPFDPSQLPDLRVSALSYASGQILRQLGAWPHMEFLRMCPYRRMAVWEKLHQPGSQQELSNRFNRTLFDAKDIGHDQLGYIVENRVIRLGLLQTLVQHKSVDFYCPAHIKDMHLLGSKPSITLENGEIYTAALVVGADGARSRVREKAGLRLKRRDYEQQCFVATVEIEAGQQQDITWQAFTPTGPQALLPLPDIQGKSYASIVWYNQPESVRKLMSLPGQDFLSELSFRFPKELPPVKALHERGFFPLARSHALNYFRPGTVLVGDAAHTINPLAGQGVNLGLQDAAWLSEVLADAFYSGQPLGSPEVLGRYEQARFRDNQLMMATMDGFYHTFSNNSLPLKLLRNAALSIAGRTQSAVKEVMKYAMGISGKQPRLARGIALGKALLR